MRSKLEILNDARQRWLEATRDLENRDRRYGPGDPPFERLRKAFDDACNAYAIAKEAIRNPTEA